MAKEPTIDEVVLENHGDFDLTLSEDDLQAARQGYRIRDGNLELVAIWHQYGVTDLAIDRLAKKYPMGTGEVAGLRMVIQREYAHVGRIIKANGFTLHKPIEVKFEGGSGGEDYTAVHVTPTRNGEGRELYGHGSTRRDAVVMLFEVMAGIQGDLLKDTQLSDDLALLRDYLTTLFKPAPAPGS